MKLKMPENPVKPPTRGDVLPWVAAAVLLVFIATKMGGM